MTNQVDEAALVRFARKEQGLCVREAADRFRISPTRLSALETGSQKLKVQEWAQICEATGIPFDSIRRGVVERWQRARFIPKVDPKGFEVPERLTENCGSSVRLVRGFLQVLIERAGKERAETLLKETWKIDPDYFLNLDHALNMSFGLELLEQFANEGHLTQANVQQFCRAVVGTSFSTIQDKVVTPSNITQLMNDLIRRINHVELNCAYEVEGRTDWSIDASVTPNPHAADVPFRHDVVCPYKAEVLRQLCATVAPNLVTTVQELECVRRNKKRCLFRVTVL